MKVDASSRYLFYILMKKGDNDPLPQGQGEVYDGAFRISVVEDRLVDRNYKTICHI